MSNTNTTAAATKTNAVNNDTKNTAVLEDGAPKRGSLIELPGYWELGSKAALYGACTAAGVMAGFWLMGKLIGTAAEQTG